MSHYAVTTPGNRALSRRKTGHTTRLAGALENLYFVSPTIHAATTRVTRWDWLKFGTVFGWRRACCLNCRTSTILLYKSSLLRRLAAWAMQPLTYSTHATLTNCQRRNQSLYLKRGVNERLLPKWYSPGGPWTAIGQKDATAMTTLNSGAGSRVACSASRQKPVGLFIQVDITIRFFFFFFMQCTQPVDYPRCPHVNNGYVFRFPQKSWHAKLFVVGFLNVADEKKKSQIASMSHYKTSSRCQLFKIVYDSQICLGKNESGQNEAEICSLNQPLKI